MEKQICNCGKVAVWIYMPSGGGENPFYCDNCVSRGCSCNNYYVSEFPEIVDEYKGLPHKIVEGVLIPLDERGKELPCCEYWYDAEGFDKD